MQQARAASLQDWRAALARLRQCCWHLDSAGRLHREGSPSGRGVALQEGKGASRLCGGRGGGRSRRRRRCCRCPRRRRRFARVVQRVQPRWRRRIGFGAALTASARGVHHDLDTATAAAAAVAGGAAAVDLGACVALRRPQRIQPRERRQIGFSVALTASARRVHHDLDAAIAAVAAAAAGGTSAAGLGVHAALKPPPLSFPKTGACQANVRRVLDAGVGVGVGGHSARAGHPSRTRAPAPREQRGHDGS